MIKKISRRNKNIRKLPDSQEVIIKLNETDFQTNGLFEFSLETPLAFEPGQFIGIRQPRMDKARSRFYYDSTNNQIINRVSRKFIHQQQLHGRPFIVSSFK